jgi:hypothetical protein
MKPILAAALAAAAVAALAALGGHGSRATRVPETAPARSGAPLALSLCPPGSLPDDGVCIPAPSPRRATTPRGTERIPRRPDRAVEYGQYALPLEHVVSVAELGEQAAPDGGALPSGIAVEGAPGAAVSAVALEGQEGPATVLYRGSYWGLTVVTLHSVQVGGRKQQYVVTVGRLGSARPLDTGATVAQGGTLGTLGAAAPALVVLQTRLLRPGIDDVRGMSPAALNDAANSVPTDPRNVLPLAPK